MDDKKIFDQADEPSNNISSITLGGAKWEPVELPDVPGAADRAELNEKMQYILETLRKRFCKKGEKLLLIFNTDTDYSAETGSFTWSLEVDNKVVAQGGDEAARATFGDIAELFIAMYRKSLELDRHYVSLFEEEKHRIAQAKSMKQTGKLNTD